MPDTLRPSLRENLFPSTPPPLPAPVAASLDLRGDTCAFDVALRGRGGLFTARAIELSPKGIRVAFELHVFDRSPDDCFRTGADVRFRGTGFAVRSDLVHAVRGMVDGKERLIAAYSFRRTLSGRECADLGIDLQPAGIR